MPRAEVEAKRSLFAAHGVEVTAFFVERDIEARRAEAADRLRQTFGRLGYEPDGRGTP